MKMQNGFMPIAVIALSLVLVLPGSTLAKGPNAQGPSEKAKGPVEKAKGPHEKATGHVGYDAYETYRWIEFNAHEQAEACRVSLVGDWVISVDFNGRKYDHDMTVTAQDENGDLFGTGAYPAGGLYSITWELADSYVDDDFVALALDYDDSNYLAILEGYIGANGAIGGTWTSYRVNGDGDLNGPFQSGSWTTTSGKASAEGCDGKGMLRYEDENGSWYDVEVALVKVVGDTAWFAGPVVAASNSSWVERWLFAKVFDGGEPAAGVDQLWGSFTTMEGAADGVAMMWDPKDGPFAVQEGNLQVHTYE